MYFLMTLFDILIEMIQSSSYCSLLNLNIVSFLMGLLMISNAVKLFQRGIDLASYTGLKAQTVTKKALKYLKALNFSFINYCLWEQCQLIIIY